MSSENQDNRLLATLPPADLGLLRPHLQRVWLFQSQPLIRPAETLTRIYFPITALASLVTVMSDGRIVEAGCVGREGMVGMPVLLGHGATPMQTVVQVAGAAYQANAEAIKKVFERGGAFHRLIHSYMHTLFVVASQSAACNRLHNLEQRMSRWLLMSSDGIASDEVALTHEYLAAMLGVRRAGVTEGALKLQRDGLIRYSRGKIEILERKALELRACECYLVVKEEYERLLNKER